MIGCAKIIDVEHQMSRLAIVCVLLLCASPALAQNEPTTNRLQDTSRPAGQTTNSLQDAKTREPTTTGLGTQPASREPTTSGLQHQGKQPKKKTK
jgi:hypothetical protein